MVHFPPENLYETLRGYYPVSPVSKYNVIFIKNVLHLHYWKSIFYCSIVQSLSLTINNLTTMYGNVIKHNCQLKYVSFQFHWESLIVSLNVTLSVSKLLNKIPSVSIILYLFCQLITYCNLNTKKESTFHWLKLDHVPL